MPERVHLVDVPPPDVVWLAMGGSTDVTPGRRVAAGDIVAGVEGTSSCAVAPLAGEIGAIRTLPDTAGRQVRAVAIAVDDDAEAVPTPRYEPADIGNLTRSDLAEWIALLHTRGVRACRHNSPDLAAQLHAATHRPLDTVVCHAIEADPLLPLQTQWLLRHLEAAREGVRLLARLVGARRVLLAVPESDERRVVRYLRRLGPARGEAGSEPLGLRVVPLGRTYPQADPTLLAWTLLGRRLPPQRLPTHVGMLMLDAVAAVAVGEAALGAGVCRRLPMGIRDHRGEVAVLAEVWRGSRISDVLKQLSMLPAGFRDAAAGAPLAAAATDTTPPAAQSVAAQRSDGARHAAHLRESPRIAIRAGDFLRKRPAPTEAILDHAEIILHVTAPLPIADSEPCIRCGWCLDICPTRVHPAGLLEAAQQSAEPRQAAAAPALARRFGAAACIECGLCEYVCPSQLHLLDAARVARRLISEPEPG